MAPSTSEPGITVAVTGPTGDIGRSFVAALERTREVKEILGMARRPFDPASRGWKKVSYRRGDVLNRRAVMQLVREADVVVHLAFMIMGSAKQSRHVNLDGSRNVFEACVRVGAPRLIYASSVAAYGFHPDNPQPLTEASAVRGTAAHYYSAQKAEVEELLQVMLRASKTEAYLFRPCIVAGPDAPTLIESIPYMRIASHLPGALRGLIERVSPLRPVLPDTGVHFQLVHHDDVASAMRAAVLGRGKPGVFNLAGPGELTIAQLAAELGWHSLPVPELAVDAAAGMVAHMGFLPAQAQWIAAVREPAIMSTAKARRELRWRPRHSALETLRETVRAARMNGLVR